MYGKTHTKETLALMSKNSIGTNVGEKSGLYGKFGKDHPGFGRKMSAKDKQETSARFKGIPKSDEHKRKLRLAQINNIQRKYGQNFPNYNETSCIAFDRLNSELSLNGQHAENGGEFYIKQLGYWVDFYVPELNLVIEWDEAYHSYQKEKDAMRQNEITEHLQCTFLRVEQDSFDYNKLKQTVKELYHGRN